jgi:hypothetical protein
MEWRECKLVPDVVMTCSNRNGARKIILEGVVKQITSHVWYCRGHKIEIEVSYFYVGGLQFFYHGGSHGPCAMCSTICTESFMRIAYCSVMIQTIF